MQGDDYLISPSGTFAAYMQDDANLVLCYATAGAVHLDQPYWSACNNAPGYSSSPGPGPHFATMQEDGNFVLYAGTPASAGGAYWATSTRQEWPRIEQRFRPFPYKESAYVAAMQDDGNFVIYTQLSQGSALWASNTTWAPDRLVNGAPALGPGQWMPTGGYIMGSAATSTADEDAKFCAYLREDGDIKVYFGQPGDFEQQDSSLLENYPSCSVGTRGPGPHFAWMQPDNNFVLYNGANPGSKGNSPYWATGTNWGGSPLQLHLTLTWNELRLWDNGGAAIWPVGEA